MDLSSAGPWTDLDGQGIGRALVQSFPTQCLSQLYAGNVYVEIDSLSYPDGALRAQFEPVAETLVPESSSLVTLGLGVAFLRGRCQRVRESGAEALNPLRNSS